jgi:hypothetical protein
MQAPKSGPRRQRDLQFDPAARAAEEVCQCVWTPHAAPQQKQKAKASRAVTSQRRQQGAGPTTLPRSLTTSPHVQTELGGPHGLLTPASADSHATGLNGALSHGQSSGYQSHHFSC